MGRLVTFGCSFTYGSELPDCTGKVDLNSFGQLKKRKPSKFAWPQVLGDLMGKEVCNHSAPASSNLEILCEILDFKFQPDDIVVIMWSMSFRELFFKEIKKQEKGIRPWKQLTVWSKGIIGEDFQKAKEIDYIKRTWIYLHHANLYLKNKNTYEFENQLTFIHYPAAPWEIQELKPDFIEAPDNIYWTRTEKIDDAADGEHPGVKSHKKQAKEIKKILEERLR